MFFKRAAIRESVLHAKSLRFVDNWQNLPVLVGKEHKKESKADTFLTTALISKQHITPNFPLSQLSRHLARGDKLLHDKVAPDAHRGEQTHNTDLHRHQHSRKHVGEPVVARKERMKKSHLCVPYELSNTKNGDWKESNFIPSGVKVSFLRWILYVRSLTAG